MGKSMIFTPLGLSLLLNIACQSGNQEASKADATVSSAQAADSMTVSPQPISLFDGTSLSGWHVYGQTGDIKNWKVEDGAMVCLGATKDAHGGDLVTDRQFDNFELNWEWKVDKGSNSGVMYHVVEDSLHKAPYETGPEYQVIDDVGFPDKLEAWQQAGADYAMYPANDKKKLMPVGEWNTSRIIFNNGHVEHWLNGEKIVEFDRNSAEWKAKRNSGKWKDYPDYAKVTRGHVALQDHGQRAYYRNITIREL
jgi:hypothetical protein